jgi:hypothetical protein
MGCPGANAGLVSSMLALLPLPDAWSLEADTGNVDGSGALPQLSSRY